MRKSNIMKKAIVAIALYCCVGLFFSYAEGGVNSPELLLSIDAHKIHIVSETYPGLNKSVQAVAFSPDGKFVVSGGVYGYIKFWDSKTGKLVQSVNVNNYPGASTTSPVKIGSLSFSPDGSLLASGVEKSSNVMLWDVSNIQEIKLLQEFSGRVVPGTAIFSPDGKYLAYSDAGFIRMGFSLVDLKTSKRRKFIKFSSSIASMAFSPNGRIMATGLTGGKINIWDLESGDFLFALNAHKRDSPYFDGVYATIFSPDGSMLVSSGDDYTVKIWSTRTWEEIKTIPVVVPKGYRCNVTSVRSLAFSPDGSILAAGLGAGVIYILDPSSGKILKSLRGHQVRVKAISFSNDGVLIVSGSRDGTVKIWKNPF